MRIQPNDEVNRNLVPFCGKRGIRTPDTLLTYTRFPGVPLQPLEHLSLKSGCKYIHFSVIDKSRHLILNFVNQYEIFV